MDGTILTYELFSAGDGDIYKKDVSGGGVPGTVTGIAIGGATNDRYPTIQNGNITWVRGGNTLALWTPAGGTTTKGVCAGACTSITMPQIWSNKIVWHDDTGKIRFSTWAAAPFSISNAADIVLGSATGQFPHIHNNRVVWQDGTAGVSRVLKYSDWNGAAWGAPNLIKLPPDSPPESCSKYAERPRVGGNTAAFVIWRGINCNHNGVNYANALMFTFVTGNNAGNIYFVDELGASSGNTEPTDYDIYDDAIIYRDKNGDIQLVQFDPAAL